MKNQRGEGVYMSRKTDRNDSRSKRRIYVLPLIVGLLSAALSVSAFAQSQEFPTYQVGMNQNAVTGPTYTAPLSAPWVVSDGTIITPAGTQVYLCTTTRAKAIAFNPLTSPPTAAVLQMGAPQSVTVFNALTGAVLQNFSPPLGNHSGSSTGITYAPNGQSLLFSQDGGYGPAYVAIASVNLSTGMLTSSAQVSVPLDVNAGGYLTNVTCFPNSPPGTTGSIEIPCGQTVSLVSDGAPTSYPMGIAISPDGTTAYVSNEAGRVAKASDFQGYSNGTPVVVTNPTGATSTGTISVVNLASFTVTKSINVGLHPTGMAFWGQNLLVANAYSDSISVINTATNTVAQTINLDSGLGIKVPGGVLTGVGPNSIAVDAVNNIAYVALYNANAIAVVNLATSTVSGLIPTGYAPSSVVLDATDGNLLVANDKGLGTTGYGVAPPPANTFENSYAHYYGVYDLNTHQDLGTVSIVPVPNSATLAAMTTQVNQNNHWDLWANIESASGGSKTAAPVAIPAKIGSPSLIKHVFVIIRENRTYDQILGDVAGGNGDASLAVFGDGVAAGGKIGRA